MQEFLESQCSDQAKDETIEEVLKGYSLNPLEETEIVVFQIEKPPSFEK
jgi:hypothetical protein